MSVIKQGTVSVTNGSEVVTGTGTNWLGQVAPGQVFALIGEVSYTIASVASDTSLTLTAPYGGTTKSGQTYSVTRDFTTGGLPLLAPGTVSASGVLNPVVQALEDGVDNRLIAQNPGDVAGTAATQPTSRFPYVVGSVAEMVALPAGIASIGQHIKTLGYYAAGDGGGCDYEVVAAGTGSNYGFLYEQLTESGNEAKLLGGGIMEDKTVYIPSDYGTLKSAIDDLCTLNSSQGATIELLIESGHAITHGLYLKGGDYSHFKISASEQQTILSSGFTPVSGTEVLSPLINCVMVFVKCRAPIINTLVDCSNATLEYPDLFGYVLANGSVGIGNTNKGFINAYTNGHIREATIYWRGGVWSGSKQIGLQITSSSIGNVAKSVLNDCVNNVDPPTSFGHGALDISRGSSVYAGECTIENSGENGMNVRRSFVSADGININNSGWRGLSANAGSRVYAGLSSITNSSPEQYDVFVGGGSEVGLEQATYSTTFIPVNVPHSKGYLRDDDAPDSGPIAEAGENFIKYANGAVIQFVKCLVSTDTNSLQGTNLPVLMVGDPENDVRGSISFIRTPVTGGIGDWVNRAPQWFLSVDSLNQARLQFIPNSTYGLADTTGYIQVTIHGRWR